MSTPTATAITAVTSVTASPNAQVRRGNDDLDEARDRGEDLRRAFEVREEARTLMQQVLEESLAPLHFGLRELERRLEALERRPPPAPAPAPTAVVHAAAPPVPAPVAQPVAPAPVIPPAVATLPLLPQLQPVVRAPPPGAYGGILVGAQAQLPAPPRLPSFDYDVVPFDGARRKRRVVALFALLITVIFGALFAALIWSRVG